MTRRLFVPVVVLLVLAALASAYALRSRAPRVLDLLRRQERSMEATPEPAHGAAAPNQSNGTPRGDVTIDLRRQQLIGVKTVSVVRETMEHTVRAAGVVRYDETKQADINLKVEGWIRDLFVDYTGQAIKRGQPLFSLYSPDVVNTENEYLLALKTRDQLEHSTIPDARQRAEELVSSARQRLTLWDLSAEDLRVLEDQRKPQDAVIFRSPVSGFVIEKQALKGLHAMPGQSLYKVADLSTVWIEADVYESELGSVRISETATVHVDAYPGESFSGRATYVYPYLDEKTRTNKIRFTLANPRGRLKPGMYATVELKGRGGMGVLVPTNAVLDSGTEQVVFVAQGDGLFEPRKVKTGRRLGDTIQVLEGLKEGEQVATGATFFLDSESQLRASLQGYEAPAGVVGVTPKPASGAQITFRTIPDPPQTGENQFEASITDAAGKPVDGVDVTVQFNMPAMPTMGMPAMRSEAKLSPAGGGVYRGIGQVLTAGRWETTITVTRGGQRLGSKQLTVVTR